MPFGKLSGMVAVQHGGYVTYLIKPDQTLGSYGVDTFFPSAYPAPTGLTGLKHLTTSGDHVLYIKNDLTVGGWGSDTGSTVSGPSSNTNPLHLSASENRSYLVDQAGELTIWGDNFANAATKPPEATGLIMATGGRAHSVGLKSDGTVLAWGDNARGQLNIPAGLSGVTEIAVGDDHNLALKSDGTVVAWGYNNEGQTAVPSGLSDVLQVQCGALYSIALKSDGTVVCWGKNSQGQCNVPAGLNTAVQISASAGNFALAVLSDQSVVWWGYDGSGTGEQIPPAGTLAYYPTEDPTGTISATLEFTASFDGSVPVAGDISASLGFDASFSGAPGASGDIAASLGFNASFVGESITQFGAVSAQLGFTTKFTGFQDWLEFIDPVQLQEIYLLTITGAANGLPDLEMQISSWQATNQAGARQSYLQAVIPAAADLIESIEARQLGELVLYKGYRFSDGSARKEEILRSNFDTFRYDRGHRSFTVTVSGYLGGKQSQNATRTLKGIRSISLTNGKYRVRSDIDLFLQPGMTVTADTVTFRADYINYYVSEVDKFCEVSDR